MTSGFIHRKCSTCGFERWLQIPSGAAASASKQLAIDDEAGTLGELVVKALRGAVGLMRLPVNPRGASLARIFIDLADEGAADALSPSRGVGEEILQIADRRHRGRGAMEQVMRQANQAIAVFGDQRMHRLIDIEEARPRHAGDFGCKCAHTRAAVKRVVSIPQRQPPLVVGRHSRADEEGSGHGEGSAKREKNRLADLSRMSAVDQSGLTFYSAAR